MNNTTNMKSEQLYAAATRENGEKRAALAPEIIETWRNFSKTVFKEGALPEKKTTDCRGSSSCNPMPVLHSFAYSTGYAKGSK